MKTIESDQAAKLTAIIAASQSDSDYVTLTDEQEKELGIKRRSYHLPTTRLPLSEVRKRLDSIKQEIINRRPSQEVASESSSVPSPSR